MVQLDTANCEPGYLCGRLLAVLEGAQRAATNYPSAVFVDRLYATASTAPQLTLGRLLRVAGAHLSTLERHNRDVYNAIQSQLEGVLSGLDTLPRTLTLEQQGFFSLGYYHQRAHDRASEGTGRGRREQTSDGDINRGVQST